MKIALFTETYPPYINGVATHVKLLKEIYEQMGHEVLVLTVSSQKAEDIKIIDNVIYVPGILLKKIYGYRISPPIGTKREKICLDFKPDVVHIHNEFGIADTGIKVARKLGIPLIYTLHSQYDEYLLYIGLRRFKHLTFTMIVKYLKRYFKNADVIISPSYKAQKFLDKLDLGKEVKVVENAVDYKKFKKTPERKDFRLKFRKKYGMDDDTKAFVFVGRIGEEKNIKELFKNFCMCGFDSIKAKLFIIGDGPQLDELKKLIKTYKADDKVILLGKINNSKIGDYLACMDYYTSASLSEMHSISMLEAMASGLFALIKYDHANKSQIIEGVNGFTWKNQKEFNDIFSYIINLSKEDSDKLKSSVLAYSKENSSLRQAEKILDIYKYAIEKRKNI